MAGPGDPYRPDYSPRQPGRLALDEDNSVPWLEAVEEDVPEDRISPLKIALYVLAALAALGVIVTAIMLFQRGTAGGAPELIRAPTTPYKVPPKDDGAMTVPGEGDATFNTSQGREPQGRIDMTRGPEAPAVVAAPPAGDAPVTDEKAQPAAETTAPATSGLVQLGAYKSEAAATEAWRAMIRRFPMLQGKPHSIATASVGGGTVYHLRMAWGAGADSLCERLQGAGQNCVVVR